MTRGGECWGCGQNTPRIIGSGPGQGLCHRCYERWHHHGFTGTGPYYRRPRLTDRLTDHQTVTIITSRSTRQAAADLGVSPRTVERYRAALRRAS